MAERNIWMNVNSVWVYYLLFLIIGVGGIEIGDWVNVKSIWEYYLLFWEWLLSYRNTIHDLENGCLGVCEKYFGERIRNWFWFGLSWLRETFEWIWEVAGYVLGLISVGVDNVGRWYGSGWFWFEIGIEFEIVCLGWETFEWMWKVYGNTIYY